MKKLTLASILSLSFLLGCSDDKPTLYVYSWADYFSQDLISRFEGENNCHVDITTFDSNEGMYAKLKSGASGYDIVTPTSYQVPSMLADGMIDEIDVSKIPNVEKNIDRSYEKFVYSPMLKYTVPYSINCCGIMYRKDKVDEEKVKSWKIFNDSKYKGRMTLLNDIREVIGVGLMLDGKSINTKSGEELDKAVKNILVMKPNLRKFDAESYKTEVANGSSYFGQAYSCDALQIIIGEDGDGRSDIGFSYPKEGFTTSCDELVIMKTSPNKDLAYKFIDFMFDPDNSLENMEYICAMMPNRAALEKLDPEKMKIMIPEDLSNSQVIGNFDKEPEVLEMYNKAWDEITGIEK